MGLLSSIKETAKKVVKAVAASPVGKVLDTLSVAVAHPVEVTKAIISPTKTVKEVSQKFEAKTTGTKIKEVVLGTAGLAATTIATGAAVTAVAAKGVTALLPTTTKGIITTAAVAPVVATAVINKPSLLVDTPSAVLNFQENVGELIAQPSIEKAKDIIKENPITSAVAGAAVLGAGALAIAPVISSISQTSAIKEQTEAIKEATAQLPAESNAKPKTTQEVAASATPLTPATQEIRATAGTSTSKRRKKRRVEPPRANINQNVRVVVANKTTGINITKKYLKEDILV